MDTELAAQLLGKIKRLTRFLMVEHPKEAEVRTLLVELPQVAEAVSKGNGVVRMEAPGEAPQYVVVQNGMRYLSSKPPDWVREEDLKVTRIPPAQDVEPVLFPQLQEACRQLQAVSPKIYEEWNVQQILESVSAYYGPEGMRDGLELVKLSSAVSEASNRLLEEGRSESAVERWAEDSQNCLLREYLEFRVCGNTIRSANATFTFYMLAPARDRFFEIGTTLPGELESALQNDERLTIIP